MKVYRTVLVNRLLRKNKSINCYRCLLNKHMSPVIIWQGELIGFCSIESIGNFLSQGEINVTFAFYVLSLVCPGHKLHKLELTFNVHIRWCRIYIIVQYRNTWSTGYLISNTLFLLLYLILIIIYKIFEYERVIWANKKREQPGFLIDPIP